jgi:thioredoxin 1
MPANGDQVKSSLKPVQHFERLPGKCEWTTEGKIPLLHKREVSMAGINPSVSADDRTFATMVLDSEIPVLVDFWAPWCGPCRTIASTIEELARDYAGRIRFVKVNVDEGQRTAMSLGVWDIPALILFAQGKPVDRQVGVQPKAILNDMINQWLFKHPSWAPA